MQIHRYDLDPHYFAQPKVVLRGPGNQSSVDNAVTKGASHDQTKAKSEQTDPRIAALAGKVQQLPVIRASLVEAAREKVARGDFSTREAAQQLATTSLRNEIF